jgi:PHS family inorganic phosphate transporter-like MFS transporter
MDTNPFKNVDSSKLSLNHIKIWYTSGMGFFTDAYDLFIIGAIIDTFIGAHNYAGINIAGFTSYLIGPNSAFWTGILGSSAIISAVLGQLLFGYLGDRIGRKTVYGIEASLLALGAFLSGISINLPMLILFRSIMGIGIGGDYPISATIMSEYANVKDRGKLIALVFANQGLGSVTAVVVGAISALYLPPDIAWRVMAIIGAIPAATVIYLRRKVPETPRYSLLAKGDVETAKKAAAVLGTSLDTSSAITSKKVPFSEFISRYGKLLIGTALSWALVDMAFYGTGVYSGPIVSLVLGSTFPHLAKGVYLPLGDFQADLSKEIFDGGIPFIVGLFGYFTAVALMDKLGRKLIQAQGFVMMAVLYVIVSLVMVASGTKVTGFTIPPLAAFSLYALSYFFIDFGANTTTFVIPAEVYPVRYRTTGHGISAAAGKTGAAISTYLFPTLLLNIGVKEILLMLAVLSVIGALVTLAFVKEPKNRSLEEVSEEELIPSDGSEVSSGK